MADEGVTTVTTVGTKKKALAPVKTQAMPTVGKNYFIYVNVGTNETTGAEWLLVGGQRDTTLSRKADSIATNYDFYFFTH